MKNLSILCMLFALASPSSYGTTSLPVINIDWDDHHHGWGHQHHHQGGCDCHHVQKHIWEMQQCNQFHNQHACHEVYEDQMKGHIPPPQCMQMCQQGGYYGGHMHY